VEVESERHEVDQNKEAETYLRHLLNNKLYPRKGESFAQPTEESRKIVTSTPTNGKGSAD